MRCVLNLQPFFSRLRRAARFKELLRTKEHIALELHEARQRQDSGRMHCNKILALPPPFPATTIEPVPLLTVRCARCAIPALPQNWPACRADISRSRPQRRRRSRRCYGTKRSCTSGDLLCDYHCPDPRCQLARMCKLRIGPIYLQHCARSCMPFLAVFRLQAMYRPDSHPKRAPLHGGAPSFHALSDALTLQSNIIAAKSPQPPQINNTATHSRPPTRSGHGRAE